MSVKKAIISGIGIFGALLVVALPFSGVIANAQTDLAARISMTLTSDQPFTDVSGTAPAISKPKWYTNVTFYYTIAKNGNTTSDMGEFATLANQTLNDARGWTRLGVQFKQVASGGSLHIVLAEASLLPSYSSGCTVDWSCTVGNTVVINQDRWAGASASWNNAGGSLRDYRNMVINHETGHWLGHGHEFCSGAGNPAPVMQQQSIDLQGCKFNPWPLDSELWSSRL